MALQKAIIDTLFRIISSRERIGSWTIDYLSGKSGDPNNVFANGGQGLILYDEKRSMLGEIQRGVVKIQHPQFLADGTHVIDKDIKIKQLLLTKFAHENTILECLNKASDTPNILRSLDKSTDVIITNSGKVMEVAYFVTDFLHLIFLS